MELSRLAVAANMLVNRAVAVQKGETVLIITDTERPRSITRALAYSAESAGGEVVVISMDPRDGQHQNDLEAESRAGDAREEVGRREASRRTRSGNAKR